MHYHISPIARCLPQRVAAFIFFAGCVISLLTKHAEAEFGSSGWTVLRKVQSSQVKSIASSVPLKQDIAGFLFNPAVTAQAAQSQLNLISEIGTADDAFGGILYCHPLRKAVVSGGFAYYDGGNAELNWIDNGSVQSRTVRAQSDQMGILSIAAPLGARVSMGFSVKAARSTIAETESAFAYAADAGTLLTPVKNFYLSAAVQNIGASTQFIDKKDPLPLSIYCGSGYQATVAHTRIIGAAGAAYLFEDKKSMPEIGMEAGNDAIAFHACYRFAQGDFNLQMGFRISINSISVGYSYVPAQYLNPLHRITFGYRFSRVQVSSVSLPVKKFSLSKQK